MNQWHSSHGFPSKLDSGHSVIWQPLLSCSIKSCFFDVCRLNGHQATPRVILHLTFFIFISIPNISQGDLPPLRVRRGFCKLNSMLITAKNAHKNENICRIPKYYFLFSCVCIFLNCACIWKAIEIMIYKYEQFWMQKQKHMRTRSLPRRSYNLKKGHRKDKNS